MRVSTTERQLFKRCRRKWNWQSYNRQSLSPIVNAPALDLGTLVHATLAEWTKDNTINPVEYYKHLAQLHFQKIIASYIERIGCAPSESELEPTSSAIMLGVGLIMNYRDKWHTALPPGFELIENELTLIQDIEGTRHCLCQQQGETILECSDCYCSEKDPAWSQCRCAHETWAHNTPQCACDSNHQLECTFDGVMADQNGDLYIIERKTFSRTPSLDELNNNDQFLAYQWALDKMYPDRVVGVAFDGLLKKIKPPQGKTYDDLFLRRILLRNKHELQEFGSLLALELVEMANPQVAITKTVPAVQGCQRWECSFLDVCHAQSKGEPTEHLMKMFTKTDRKKHLDISPVEVEVEV